MSSDQERQTVFIPLKLGSASQYDRNIFPLMRMKRLDQVDIVLEATMDELYKIREMAGNPTELETIFQTSKNQYDTLLSQKEQLHKQKKSFNPMKLLSAYRSVRLLTAACGDLYRDTRSASEMMRRRLLSVNTQDAQRVDYDDVPPDALISGIAIPLESQLDESTATFFSEAAEFIGSQVNLLPDGNPFADDHEVEESRTSADLEHDTTIDSGTDDSGGTSSASSRFSGASSSSSPSLGQGSGNNIFIFNNSYVASRSAIQTPTLNHGGSHNQGSSRR
ncbi:uncharacterized protein EDB91DRAFT_1180142 [Suillus paluster]|uniref:uncharacterized protein n=1 Tax=Suillus paluster TaxID=48578 RepID=UPI001B8719D5|nr:uncharacterized protein EDB91DRAFT_1180142 [Suillus paluster]KAG1719662.1 hypothetical protein EDB91DRAFT_1180142 [Suillus paluster]